MTMATLPKASLELKRLREHAGYSIRQIAAALRETGSDYGQSPSSYAYYENGYKKPYLPVDLVDALTPLLLDRGHPPISERQVFALAGTPRESLWIRPVNFTEKPDPRTQTEKEADLLAEIIQRIAQESEALSLEISEKQRARLVVEVYHRIIATGSMSQPGMVEYEVAHACRIAKGVLQSGS
jgi:transcriptional regulator with XRE-family HTH domain